MSATSTPQDVFVRLACFAAALSLVTGLLLLAIRSADTDMTSDAMARRLNWWRAHGRTVLLSGLALLLASVAILVTSRH
ncbi:hypothetical protein AB0F77_22370 [Streptomyces sp. NPDC026672]|uniref:hypothetical protein n=1 Tax=unclassified Streptomyces TaxID=2593676 RepID=UPI0033EDFF21